MSQFLILFSVSVASLSGVAYAAPSPSPSPEGKNVRSKIETPKNARPVGVRAQDPSLNGQVNTSGALSPANANSMGVGVQFDLDRPKAKAPKKPIQEDDNE